MRAHQKTPAIDNVRQKGERFFGACRPSDGPRLASSAIAWIRVFFLVVTVAAVTLVAASCDNPFAGSSSSSSPVHHEQPVEAATRDAALTAAEAELGSPYEWGGRGPEVFDCSGLITWAYKQAVGTDEIFVAENELRVDATMSDLYRHHTDLVGFDDAKPGDIVFISEENPDGSDDDHPITHGGVFIEAESATEFTFLNASSYYDEVVIDTWSTEDQIRGQWFVGIGRLLIHKDAAHTSNHESRNASNAHAPTGPAAGLDGLGKRVL